MIGGYQIIDFLGIEIDSTGETISGIYDKIEAWDGKKPLLCSNVDLDGSLISFFGVPIVTNSKYYINVGTSTAEAAEASILTLEIDGEDTVKLITTEIA